jgi:choline-sulfatase
MVVSLTHPHDPYVAPEAYWNRYSDAEIDMPAAPGPAEDPHSQRIRHVIGLNDVTITQAQVRAARRAYYAAVSYVDDQVGVLMSTLKQARFDENTVVLLLADHGDMLGERGLWYKMSFFEPACRIPLIVHAPGRFKPHRVPAPASLLDILPTLAELARTSADTATYAAPVDGHSLLPALNGHGHEGEVMGEYMAEGAIAPLVMIRRGPHKFIHSPVDPDQLYNLHDDPHELANLAATPDAAALVAAFRAEVARRWDLPRVHAAVLASQQQRHFAYAALRRGRYTPWDFQPLRDATRLYIRNDQELNDLEAMARFPQQG